MELVELFDILFLKYINAAGTLCHPQATYLNIFPLLICTHMYRDNFPQKESEFCFALNTFTYVSSTKRDSVVGVTERSERAVKWMAGQPAEARGGGRLGREPPASPRPLSWPPGPQGLCRARVPPQTSRSSGWSLVCSRSGWLCLVSWCQVLEGLHSSVVLLVPVGASLAAL